MNKLTNDKKLVVITLAILFIAISFLFIKGEVSLQKASQGYDIVAFKNTKQRIAHFDEIDDILTFYIENLNKKEEAYEITFSINNKPISQTTENIKSDKKKIVKPTQEVINHVKNNNLESFKYKVEIRKNNENKVIYKQINK